MRQLRRSFALIALLTGLPLSTRAAEPATPPSVEVTGLGEVKIEPDQVILRLGLETFGPKLKDVQNEIVQRTQALVNALKEKGVKNGDIQTEMVQIDPQYSFDQAKRKFIEYTARKNFTVTLENVESYGGVLEKALESGVDHVDGLEFKSSKIKALKDEARKLAVQDARRKAAQMAGTLGQNAGKAIHIRENDVEGPRPLLMRAAAVESFKGEGVHDALAPGEISVNSSVSVVFELK